MGQYNTNEICRLCGVSRKQLRYYEERGILSAVPRQSGNNYRTYTHEHIYEIVAAKALRNIDMSLLEMKNIIYGTHLSSIQSSLQQQINSARENLEDSLQRYEQSAIVYAKLAEALSCLKLHHSGIDGSFGMEVTDFPCQDVVSLSYSATFEDEDCRDIEYLPRLQMLTQEVNALSFGALLYTTYDHFDSQTCMFNHQVHGYKIAAPVLDRKKPCAHYDTIPAFRGVSAIHIGNPKEKRLYNTYMDLLHWVKAQGYQLENWSVEEWLISPMITNNKDFWVIRITIPFKS
ncbi:MAG: MerR family transcriptional regulator [Stomatobaculum sp.]